MIKAKEVDGRAGSDSSVLADLIDRLTAQMQAGEAIDWDQVARQHPEHAGELLHFKPTLGALGELSRSGAEELTGVARPAAPEDGLLSGVLGDFRIINEIGRGGMGVVYEAEQVSLGRRVALKVLPLASTMDPRRLQRFHNEARAAACLHHTNIVPVFAVGSERGVHFYAMQLIEGVTLASLVRDMRQLEQPVQRSRIRKNAGTLDPHSGECGYGQAEPCEAPKTTAYKPPVAAVTTAPAAALSTTKTGRDAAYYRKVAELGAKAAEALDYAHQMGVVHRDIKPGNLMLDHRGDVWITDFGLALLQSEAGPTLTGDLVGTLRYMSPEQALAKRVPIDHRTDVYSLGATLYELLTLRPVFEGGDRQELLRQIAFEEPRRPRQWNRAIPQEMETIVLKAMERNPADRYTTSQEMADDLQRYLEDKPIRARRPTLRQRLGRWGRRHPGWTATMGLAAGLLLAGLWAWEREKTQAETTARTVAAEADKLWKADRLPEALLAARRAADLLPRFGGDTSLRRTIVERLADMQLLNRLEEAQLAAAALRIDGKGFDNGQRVLLIRQAFQEYGVDVVTDDETAIAEFLRHRAVAAEIVPVLGGWGRYVSEVELKERLYRLADALDPDPRQLVSRVRRARHAMNVEILKQLAADAEADIPLPEVLLGIGKALAEVSCSKEAERLFRVGQQRYPGHFWINHDLGLFLSNMGSARAADAVRFMSAALALRPLSPAVWLNLGATLSKAGRNEEAVAALNRSLALQQNYAKAYDLLGFVLQAQRKLAEAVAASQKAIDLEPDFAGAHNNLGVAFQAQGKVTEAEASYRKAIELKPDYAVAHSNLGGALHEQGKLAAAVTACRKAIEIEPDDPAAHMRLGIAFDAQGKLAEAEASYRKAIELKPDHAEYHMRLGTFFHAQGKLAETEASYRKAIQLKPDYAEAHSNLGEVFHDRGKLAEAVACCRKAIELKPDYAMFYSNLGMALSAQGKLAEAEASFRKAIELKPDSAEAHNNLGTAFRGQEKLTEAEAACRKAIDLKPDYADAHMNLGVALKAQGKLAKAEAAIRKAIELKPDFAKAHTNLGDVFQAQGKLAEAEAAHRKAIQLRPDFAVAHHNLGLVFQVRGKPADAEAAYRKAIEFKPDYAAAHSNRGAVLLAQRKLAEAEAACHKAIQLRPDDAKDHYNLGVVFHVQGKSAEAEAAFRKAIALKPDFADAHLNLGAVLLRQRKPAEAEAACRKVIQLQPDFAMAHCNLGHSLRDQGRFADALASLKRGHKLGAATPGWRYPSEQWIREAQNFVTLDAKLSKRLRSEDQPTGAAESIALAQLCQLPCKSLYAAATRFYGEAFAQEAKLAADLQAGHRYNAACAAALAGCGQGKDVTDFTEKDRARLREQARDWLRADLDAWNGLLKKEPDKVRRVLIQTMQHWQADTDFTEVRGTQALAKLTEAERQAWQKLWADVADTLARAQGTTPERK